MGGGEVATGPARAGGAARDGGTVLTHGRQGRRRLFGRLAAGAAIALLLPALALAAGAAMYAPIFDWLAPTRIDRRGSGSAHAGGPSHPAPRRVVLISIDGLAPRLLEQTRVPTLERLAREGVSARRAETTLPPYTLPSHTSMISGVPPRVHGVDWNRYQPWDSISVPTIFSVCEREGLRCALFAGKRKLAHLAEDEPGVDRYAYADGAGAVLERAADYVEERSPDFVMIHLAGVDRAGHEQGWGSEAQLEALEQIDVRLGRFLRRIRSAGARPLSVLVTADHGGRGTHHRADRPENVRIPWIAWGAGVTPGAIEEPVSTMDTAATVVSLLGEEVPRKWVGCARLPRPGAAARPVTEPGRESGPARRAAPSSRSPAP